jgi:hypothetical protein
MYKQAKYTITGELAKFIIRINDNAFIPFDPNNTDYQDYLKWLAEGNMPEPADALAAE